jgi:hypothetical protein
VQLAYPGCPWREFFQPDGHLGRDAGPGIQQVAEGLPIDPKDSGGIGLAQPILLNTIPARRSFLGASPVKSYGPLFINAYSDNRHSTSH